MNPPRFTLPLALAKELARSLSALPGVHSLFAGRFGEVALLYPGERVAGMRFTSPKDDSHIAVHVVLEVPTGIGSNGAHDSDIDAGGIDGTGNGNKAQLPSALWIADAIRRTALKVCPQLRRVDVIFSDAATTKNPSTAASAQTTELDLSHKRT